MDKKTIISAAVFVIILISGIFLLNKGQDLSQIVLYYGEGCPHCKIVDDFISQNSIKEKVDFVEKEVWYNKINAAELAEKAKICGLKDDSIGVPFLWDGKDCLIGDVDIINFFKSKAGIQ